MVLSGSVSAVCSRAYIRSHVMALCWNLQNKRGYGMKIILWIIGIIFLIGLLVVMGVLDFIF